MLPGNRELVAPGGRSQRLRRGNEPGDEPRAPPSGSVAEPSRKTVCKWPGKWGRRAEVVPTVNLASAEGDVELDPALWGELHRYIDVEMVAVQLPLHAFYRARSVCKKWNSLPWNRPFLEQHSTTSFPKPYFILRGNRGCHQAMLVKDVMLAKWVLKPLPAFAFQHDYTCVAHGVVYTCTREVTFTREGSIVRGTVFNIHTKVFRRLPPLTIDSASFGCSKLAVHKQSGSYKVLVAYGRCQVLVYDSVTGMWSRRAASPAVFFFKEDATYCEGIMYMKWTGDMIRDGLPPRPGLLIPPPPPPPVHSEPKMFAYDFKDDLWTVLPATPPALPRTEQNVRNMAVRGLGEWKGTLRDVTFDPADNVLRVWEFEQSGQEWIEVDHMPGNILEWFLDRQACSFAEGRTKIVKTSYCEHYILIWSHGFPGASGLARLVLYDMALRSWETLNVGKDWICSCPFGS